MPKIVVDDGVQINYVLDDFTKPWFESGTVDTIVMVHGFSRNLKFWNPWVPTLGGKFKVLRYDIRGFGESSVPPKAPYSVERLAKDTLSIINQVGLDKIHFVGATSGGFVGLQFALSYPDRIKSLTLVRTPAWFTKELVAGYSLGYSDPATAIENLGIGEWAARTVTVARLDPSKADPRQIEWSTREQAKTPTWVAAAWLGCQGTLDFRPRLAELKAPTLLLVGDRNVSSPLEQQVFMQTNIPNARLAVFSGIGGGIEVLIPERCAQVTLDFLSEIS